MSFFSADMVSLVEIYQRETMELMEEFNNRLMQAAKRNRLTQEDINSIFRVVHTIKSSSAMVGMLDLSKCTHRMEDLFLMLRDVDGRNTDNDNRIIDLLYTYGDFVNSEISKVSNDNFKPMSTEKIDSQIENELSFFRQDGAVKRETRKDEKSDKPDSVSSDEDDATVVIIRFKPNCQMENVRAFQILKKVRSMCKSIIGYPDELSNKDTVRIIQSNGFKLTFVTDNKEKIISAIKSSLYVENVTELKKNDGGDNGKADEQGITIKSAKFGMVAWDRILTLQNITGELITSYTLLKSELEELPIYREIESFMMLNQRLLQELETQVNKASMMPVSSVATQYYKMVREIAKKEDKQIEFNIIGGELELDRKLLDSMSNSLIHLLRNAVDHGIESPDVRVAAGKTPKGNVGLTVESTGGSVRFTVSDDGHGMDPATILKRAKEKNMLTKPENEYRQADILKLIFAPGFSTSEIQNQYSGRGVGMDVVQKTADELGGIVHVKSEVGKGSKVIVEVPVSMTSTECIGFAVGQYPCMLPIRNIVKIHALQDVNDRIKTIDGEKWFDDDGNLLPVINLFEKFGEPTDNEQMLMVIRGLERSAALLTGSIKGHRVAVEKPLPNILCGDYRSKYCISGCAVIGNGSLGLVLNAEILLKKSASDGGNI